MTTDIRPTSAPLSAPTGRPAAAGMAESFRNSLRRIKDGDLGPLPVIIGLIVSFETAVSMARCEEIAAASPRVSGLLGATGPNADVGRELGFEFTPEGLESLYLRSRIVLASRAAGLHHPVTGVWQDIKDSDGFRRFATDARRLGYRGMVCIHPSHVALSHEVFTPAAETVRPIVSTESRAPVRARLWSRQPECGRHFRDVRHPRWS